VTATTTTRRRRPVQQAAKETATAKPASRRQRPVAEVEIPKVRPVEGYTVDLTDEGSETDRSFEKLLAKDPNGTHQEFCDWFEEKTGVRLDVKTVQYVLATYQEFQRSPEHRAITQAKRTAALEKKATAELARKQRALKAAKAAGLEVVES
jgi:sulfur relay (sulfurtransferase) DsrC/TusE family protein